MGKTFTPPEPVPGEMSAAGKRQWHDQLVKEFSLALAPAFATHALDSLASGKVKADGAGRVIELAQNLCLDFAEGLAERIERRQRNRNN